jgi:tetratricopeptide (TPR) repeat protein
VPKLLIYRGETLLEERDLTEQTVTIGRGAQNTIVLEDPSKGVSREHAEIRYAGGRYTLVDRQSQNGIWVSGSRVPAVVLEPDVIASVGPYRLTVKAPVAPPVPAGTLETTIPEAAPEQTLAGVRAAPLELDKLAPDVKAAPAPPPPAPAPKPSKPPRQTGTESRGTGVTTSRAGLAIAAGIALVALSAFIGYKVIHKPPPPPAWDEAVAESLVASGKCQEALDTQIAPALKADPNNPKAIALRDRCAAPPPQAPPTASVPPTVPPVPERLNQADSLLAAKECQQAIDIANAVLSEEPANDRAKDIVSRGTTCLAPPAATTEKPTVAAAVAVPPSQGGLEPLPNETDRAYRERNKGMRSKFDEAITLLQNKKYQQAKRALDDIAPQVPNGYLDLAQRRQEAVEGMRGEAKAAFDSAQAADRANDFETALNLYRRAHDIDPSIQVDALMQKLNERRIALGTDRCNRGLTEASFANNQEAIRLLQEAVKFLPANHECVAKARETLQKLGK